jgi:hypothetical protein
LYTYIQEVEENAQEVQHNCHVARHLPSPPPPHIPCPTYAGSGIVPLMNPFVKREKSLSESIDTEWRKSAIFVRVTLLTKLFLLELRCKPEKKQTKG